MINEPARPVCRDVRKQTLRPGVINTATCPRPHLPPSLFLLDRRLRNLAVISTQENLTSGAMIQWPGSDLDLHSHLDHLRRRHPEVGSGKVGVQVHSGEQALAPKRHTPRMTAWHNHNPAEIIGDLFRVDTQKARIAACLLQAIYHLWALHEPVAELHPGNPGA